RLAEPLGRMDDLPLEVRRVDRVVVDDPERADAGSTEVERCRRAETAGSDQEDSRFEQLQLPLLAHLRDEQATALALALLGGKRLRELGREAVSLPVSEAAGKVDGARVAQLLEGLRRER